MEWLALALIAIVSYQLGKVAMKKQIVERQGVRKKSYKNLNEDLVLIDNIKLSEEQEMLFNRIENCEEHFFITGLAGTGKSILLQYLKYKSRKRLVVGAFTGVAALNVGGQTLNSLFGLPIGFIDTANLRISNRVSTLMRHIDMIVIDEVSMVRADMMDAIDVLLRRARKNEIPFGGVQIVMFGDLYQLPPIVSDKALHEYFAHNHGGPYFFNANAWQEAQLHTFELKYNFRQKDDEEFRHILNAVRKNQVDENTLTTLNKRCIDPISFSEIITLAPRNDTVDQINSNRLYQIEGPIQEYKADIAGNLEKSAFPAEEFLKLKKGAQIMLLKNDPEKRWVNGTIGIINSLSPTEIRVCINKEIVYSIPRTTWKKIRYYYDAENRKIEEEVLSTFTQFPLKLAWAFTIHKSQGKTYNSVLLDMEGGAFAHGQTYVALSRCTSLTGLHLSQSINREDIITDPIVVNFMEQINVETI